MISKQCSFLALVKRSLVNSLYYVFLCLYLVSRCCWRKGKKIGWKKLKLKGFLSKLVRIYSCDFFLSIMKSLSTLMFKSQKCQENKSVQVMSSRLNVLFNLSFESISFRGAGQSYIAWLFKMVLATIRTHDFFSFWLGSFARESCICL